MKIWKYIQVIMIIICMAIIARFQYWAGYENGVHRTEQCHAQYGVMKADYEEHFICMY